jgi:hypothetical protein
MSEGRTLRSKGIALAPKPTLKAPSFAAPKKKSKKDTKKPAPAISPPPKADIVADALNQAQKYIARTSSKEENTSSKKKRGRDDEEDAEIDESTSDIAAADVQASKWMETDEYALELAERTQEIATRFAKYEPMHALARKQLKGKALTAKLQEIKDKLDNLEEIHQGLIKLNEKRRAVLFQAALKSITDARINAKKRRIESEPSEHEDLAVSDGK